MLLSFSCCAADRHSLPAAAFRRLSRCSSRASMPCRAPCTGPALATPLAPAGACPCPTSPDDSSCHGCSLHLSGQGHRCLRPARGAAPRVSGSDRSASSRSYCQLYRGRGGETSPLLVCCRARTAPRAIHSPLYSLCMRGAMRPRRRHRQTRVARVWVFHVLCKLLSVSARSGTVSVQRRERQEWLVRLRAQSRFHRRVEASGRETADG